MNDLEVREINKSFTLYTDGSVSLPDGRWYHARSDEASALRRAASQRAINKIIQGLK